MVNESTAYYQVLDVSQNKFLPISTMNYKDFLIRLATTTSININTIHRLFCDVKNEFNINDYMNEQTIRIIGKGFNKYLLDNATDKFIIEYKKISVVIHPTKLTDKKGDILKEINASDVGVFDGDNKVADNYLFEELFYDSSLEKENILENIEAITAFTKIPKKSMKIPVVGGLSYSPDFAYVVKDRQGNQTLNLIVETKGKEDDRDLINDEKRKIKHAEKFFKSLEGDIKVKFETQFDGNAIESIIRKNIK